MMGIVKMVIISIYCSECERVNDQCGVYYYRYYYFVYMRLLLAVLV